MQNQSSTTNIQKEITKRRACLGDRFNKLVVIDDIFYSKLLNGKKRTVICKCDCGKEKEIALHHLTSGKTTSCGCLKAKKASDRLRTHNMAETRFYSIYKRMDFRCSDRNNIFYYARGIKNEFKSFEHFKEVMLETYRDDLTLERINVFGNYSPSNCTWIPFSEQARNRRNTVRYNGEPLISFCERNGLNNRLIQGRLRRGWSIESAIDTPLKINQNTFR